MLKAIIKDEGFALMEILIAVAIIGILTAIALPSFVGQEDKGKGATSTFLIRL